MGQRLSPPDDPPHDDKPSGARSSRLAAAACVALIILGGLALRLWHNGWGIPRYFHMDERTKVKRVLKPMFDNGSLDPGYFRHPAFLLYSTGATAWTVSRLTGRAVEEPLLLRSGRTVVGVTGGVTLVLAFLLGQALGGTWCGILAAFFLAVAPLHVLCSHYMKEDVPLAMWVTLQVLFCVRYVRQGRRADLFLAALCSGLAAATKYIGVGTLAFIALAAAIRWRTQRQAAARGRQQATRAGVRLLREAALCGLIALVVFVALNPFMLVSGDRARSDMAFEVTQAWEGQPQVELRVGPWRQVWTYHLRESLAPGMGLGILAVSLAGLCLALWRREGPGLLVALAVLAAYILHEGSPLKYNKYMMPLLPMLAALAGYFLASLAQAARMRFRNSSLAIPVIVLVALAASACPLWRSIRNVRAMIPDTRALAGTWLNAHCPPGTRIFVDGHDTFGPTVDPPLECRWAVRFTDTARDRVRLDLATQSCDFGDEKPLYRPHYLVTTSLWYRRSLDNPSAPEEERRYYAEEIPRLLGQPLKVFRAPGGSYGMHNPDIEVYRLPLNPLPAGGPGG